jgi:CubicO group peptidase (beta-lactamase class C family)
MKDYFPKDGLRKRLTPVPAARKGEYGYQFWLNAGAASNPADRLYPELPADMYFADGFEGQNVFIIPSKDLVVVRLGLSKHGDYDVTAMLNNIMKALKN